MFGDIVEEDLDEHKSARNCDDNLKEPNHVIRNTATQNLVKEIIYVIQTQWKLYDLTSQWQCDSVL